MFRESVILSTESREGCRRSVSNGDELERCFRVHQAPLVRWLTKRIGDADAARDVSQSAFMYLWSFAEREAVTHPRALLFKTAAWLASNEIRRRRRFSRQCSFLEDIIEDDEPFGQSLCEQSPEESTSLRQETELIFKLLEKMPEKVRLAFKLHRIEELTYDQIAKRMCVSKSSVEKYMIHALGRLRASRNGR